MLDIVGGNCYCNKVSNLEWYTLQIYLSVIFITFAKQTCEALQLQTASPTIFNIASECFR